MIVERLKLSLKRYKDGRLYKSRIPPKQSGWDENLKNVFCSDEPFEKRVRHLVIYFTNSWIRSTCSDRTRAYFHGAFSYNDRDIDAIEGTTRFLPFIASVLTNSIYSDIEYVDKENNSLEAMFISAIVNGTNPYSTGYWGEIEDYSQLICEGADVALAVWIARDRVFSQLSSKEKSNLIVWLRKCASKKIVDNNWHLFRQTIQLVLSSLDKNEDSNVSSYERIKSLYVGEGWFSDGDGGHFDFYNAWAFHYSLFWFTEIDENFDRNFISEVNSQFCQTYQKLFTLRGFPIFGRSHCYRTAASSPLLASVLLKNGAVENGRVKRVFDQIWRFVIGNDGVAGGVPTQGYVKKDLRFLDEYSGPASSLWGLRSLILLLHQKSNSEVLNVPDKPLAIEISDYNLKINSIRLKIIGNKEQGIVSVDWLDRKPIPKLIENYSLKHKFKAALSQRPQRPKNSNYKNKLKCYSSVYPFHEEK
ncbi:MAG TPA: hypothetical protein DG048_12645 [Pseudoalteromonas sp.]|nr:hypothetical protein [Pseudoalteromonas sp.]|tara:strand:+ start:544 stop:1965 length:1422 start_codon:yes stop_codon:yes gene_type:complete